MPPHESSADPMIRALSVSTAADLTAEYGTQALVAARTALSMALMSGDAAAIAQCSDVVAILEQQFEAGG